MAALAGQHDVWMGDRKTTCSSRRRGRPGEIMTPTMNAKIVENTDQTMMMFSGGIGMKTMDSYTEQLLKLSTRGVAMLFGISLSRWEAHGFRAALLVLCVAGAVPFGVVGLED